MSSPPPRTYSRLAVVWIVWWSAWSLVFVVATIAEGSGADPDSGDMFGGVLLTVLTAALAAARVVVGRTASRRPVEAARPTRALPASAAPRLPGRKSAAREPMERLAGAEIALRDLLRQLGDAPVPREVVDAARRTATETAARLRVIAAKIEAVEAAVAHSPAGRRASLEDGTRSLLAHLERGLDGYGELIAAAGHLVLADSANPMPDGLVEATDHLAGLAAALRELSREP